MGLARARFFGDGFVKHAQFASNFESGGGRAAASTAFALASQSVVLEGLSSSEFYAKVGAPRSLTGIVGSSK
jgi:hypothetical protein